MAVGSAPIFGEGVALRSGAAPSPGYPPVDTHVHALALAQLEAAAAMAERLDRAYASIERRLDRIAANLAGVEAPPAVSPGQMRLVAGG